MKSPVQVSWSYLQRDRGFSQHPLDYEEDYPYIYSMFRNFAAIAFMFHQFIPFKTFYILFPSKP
jgi:hypothetical protein